MIYDGGPSSLSFGFVEQSYSNFLASTVTSRTRWTIKLDPYAIPDPHHHLNVAYGP